MKKTCWGILGTAGIAVEQLIPAILRSANAEVTAIATRTNIKRAGEIAEEFSIEKVYTSYEELLEASDIDIVYIPVPNHLHKEWAMKAAENGKHVLCEKPAALNEADVHELKQVFAEHNVQFMEGFMYIFHPQHERVKQIIATGDIGEIRYVTGSFSFYMPDEERTDNIRMDAQKGGGSIYDVGCYAIHAIRNILSREPETVQIHGLVDPTYKVVTDVVGYLSFADGIQVTIDASFNLPMRHEYHIFGTKGTIRVPRAFRPDLHGGEGIVIIEKEGRTISETINGDQYRNQVEHFSEVVLNKDMMKKNNIENTINNARIVDACYKSLETGREVTVS